MIDIVIPFGKGSQWDNRELRFCLRGIEKFLTNYRHIYIIGDKLEWMNDGTNDHRIFYYPQLDRFNHERNIYEKIRFACTLPDLSEDFFFMNDDHFLIQPTDAMSYPHYCWTDLENKIKNRARNDGYCISMRNTLAVLKEKERPIKYFDIHTPIVYNKQLFLEVNKTVNWKVGMGYVIKSLYANMVGLTGPELKDLKVKGRNTYEQLKEKINSRHVFSMADSAINADLEKLMFELYPERSRYEVKPVPPSRKEILRKKYYANRK